MATIGQGSFAERNLEFYAPADTAGGILLTREATTYQQGKADLELVGYGALADEVLTYTSTRTGTTTSFLGANYREGCEHIDIPKLDKTVETIRRLKTHPKARSLPNYDALLAANEEQIKGPIRFYAKDHFDANGRLKQR